MGHIKETFSLPDNSTSHDIGASDQTQLVRCMAADTLVIVLKFMLIIMIMGLLGDINHESRAAPIMLNDLMTQFDQVIQADLNHAVYKYIDYTVSNPR